MLLATIVASLVACGGSGGSGGSSAVLEPKPTPIAKNEAPTITAVTIENITTPSSAEAFKDNQLKVSYSYLDSENDKEAGVEYHWQRTDSDGNFQNIEGASEALYTLTADDTGKNVRVGVLPIASIGTLRGINVFSSVLEISSDTAPKALDVEIKTTDAKLVVGSQVVGEYNYSDENRDSEGNTQYRWHILDSNNNEVDLSTEKTLVVPRQALGKTLYFSVTPEATTGVSTGNKVVVSRDVQIEKIFFTANVSVLVDVLNSVYENKPHLFLTDGTEDGTIQIKNLDGVVITKPLELAAGWIFLLKPEGKAVELWVSDGTVEGTKRHSADTDASPLYPRDLTVTNGMAYFGGYDVDHGVELWRFDEATGDVLRLTDILPSEISSGNSLPMGMTYMAEDDAIYFSAIGLDADNNLTGRELFSLPLGNTTASSAHLVKDINPGAGSSNPTGLTVFKDKLYFQAWDGADGNMGGNELWVSDGGNLGTKMLKDLTSDAHSYPTNFTIADDDLYFTTSAASDGSKGDLWRTRGTDESTNEVARNFQNAASQLLAVDGALIFSGELSDKEIAFIVTAQEDISDIDVTTRSNAKNPVGMVRLKDEIIFQATGNVGGGKELYRINLLNGTFHGPIERIADINVSGSSTPSGMTVVNGIVLFSANDGENYGNELYSYDGEGVMLLKDILPGSSSSNPELQLKTYFPIIL